ncbi:MAG TPA: magnesium chelatase domain-containing protein [Ignavibacteriales bacterium]|nr:magnesium chelatase domain-containing protein [Ignavibacteriales bacterium]
MLVKTFGSAVYGIKATTITIEVNISQGVNFYLVGLPDVAVKESQQRIESALQTHGYRMPGKKVVINMAPADIRKEGSAYDLPLAIGILAGSEQIMPDKLSEYVIMGELSLDGSLQPIKGVLPIALQAREEGFKGIVLPLQNAREAAVVEGIKVFGEEFAVNVNGSFGNIFRLVKEVNDLPYIFRAIYFNTFYNCCFARVLKRQNYSFESFLSGLKRYR